MIQIIILAQVKEVVVSDVEVKMVARETVERFEDGKIVRTTEQFGEGELVMQRVAQCKGETLLESTTDWFHGGELCERSIYRRTESDLLDVEIDERFEEGKLVERITRKPDDERIGGSLTVERFEDGSILDRVTRFLGGGLSERITELFCGGCFIRRISEQFGESFGQSEDAEGERLVGRTTELFKAGGERFKHTIESFCGGELTERTVERFEDRNPVSRIVDRFQLGKLVGRTVERF